MTFDRPTDDADGLVVPTPRGDLALAHARRLTAVAGELGDTAALLGAVRSALAEWAGDASALFEAGRVDLVAELATTADDVARAADVLARFGAAAPPEASAMRAARQDVELARARRAAALAHGAAWTPDVDAAEARAWDRWDRAKLGYERLVGSVRGGLQHLVRSLPDRRPTAADHVLGFTGRFVGDAVVAPAAGAWQLLRGAVTDPSGTLRDRWAQARAVPRDLADPGALLADRLDEAVDGDGWRRGRYGEALGAVAATATDRWFSRRPPERRRP